MTPKYCIISLMILQMHSVHSGSSREAIIEEEISHWCKAHPFGRIYSYGNYHRCSHEQEDKKEDQVKNLNMNGVSLRIGIIPNKMSYDYDCGGYQDGNYFRSNPSYSDFILNLLRWILGFDVQFVTTDTWGAWDEMKKNWTGLIGLAKNNIIDLGICHTTITHSREDVVDFLLTTLSSTKSFIYSPAKLPLTRDVFVLTFSPMLWLSFFASIILLILCFRLSTWAHSKLRPDHEPWSWIEVIMWANAAICQQSYSRHPKGSSCRTTFLIGYLITYLLYTGFAAGVTSHLAVQGYDNHLGFKDVVLMKMNLVTQSHGTHFDFIKDSPDPYARSLYSNLRELLQANRVDSLQELFARLEQENFIGLGTTVTLRNYLIRKIPSRFKDFTLSQIINSHHRKAFIVPKNSPYKETFNYWILRMMEAGLLDYGEKEYIRVEDVTCCQQPGWSSAGLGNVLSAVVVLCGGWFFSVLILFGKYITSPDMSDSDPNVVCGGPLPFEVPLVTMGELLFKSLYAAPPDEVLNVEAESGRSVTCSEFLLHSIRIAESMKDIGFQPGDCAALIGKNGIDIFAAAVACLFSGGKMSPVDNYSKAHEFLHVFKILEVKIIFCDAEICDVVTETVSKLGLEATIVLLFGEPDVEYPHTKLKDFIKEDVDITSFRPVPSTDTSQSIALLAWSSGTTGLPKAVIHSDKNLVFQLLSWRELFMKQASGKITWLHVSHFFWITGVDLFFFCTCALQKRVLVRNLLPQNILHAIDTYKPHITFLPPVLIHRIANDPDFEKYDVTSLMVLSTGGGALEKSTRDQISTKWPSPLHLLQGYGTTEVCGLFTSMPMEFDVSSVGRLIPGAQVKIIKENGEPAEEGEEGELWLKSESMMLGYLKNEEATRECTGENGWWRSGDKGHVKNKAIYITGRIKELIKNQGFQISPSELEELIGTVSGVKDVGVAGIKIDDYTTHPMALVVKKEDSDVTEEDIMKCVNENTADYKHLRAGVCFVDEIPRTPTGKIRRVVLQSLADTLYMGD